MSDPRDDQGWTDDGGIYLYMIAAADPLFSAVEQNLRETGQVDCLHEVIKLLQDVGIEMIGGPRADLSGLDEDAARLHRDFESVTPARLHCLYRARDLLTDDTLKDDFQKLLDQCPPLPVASSAPTARSPRNRPA